MAMVVVDDSRLQDYRSQPKSGGLVSGSAAAWRSSTYLVVLGQTVWTYIRTSVGKTGPSHPTFQTHSRSSEPSWIDRLPVWLRC